MTDTPDLQPVCDTCLTVIADDEGHVWVDQDQAHKTALRLRGDTIPWPGSDGTEDVRIDGGIPWQTTHTNCAPNTPSWAYAIPVERINTWPSFLHWTAHLMGKGWLDATNWESFILQTISPHHAAVSGLRPLRPQNLDFRGIGA